MANTQANFGFRHVGDLTGAAPTYQYSTYAIQKSTASAIGFGDPVIRVANSTAYITLSTPNAATTNPIIGIFYGCQYQPTSGPTVWSPSYPGGAISQGDIIAYVCDSPNAVFLAATLQTSLSTADVGKVINFSGGAPSTVGQQLSTATLDQGTLNSTGGTALRPEPFKVVGIYGATIGGYGTNYGGVGNGTDQTTNYNWAFVTFNAQINKLGVGF